jgi:hypothetical protein
VYPERVGRREKPVQRHLGSPDVEPGDDVRDADQRGISDALR